MMEIRESKKVEKVWGEELLVVNNENFCGKILVLKKGFRCSIHRHAKKETFYILEGKVYFEKGNDAEKMKTRILQEGDIVDIDSNEWHRFAGLEDSRIAEFSTPDVESERYVESEKIPDNEFEDLGGKNA